MTLEEFELKQSKMSDIELINLCQKEVGELASTYGKSLTMTIPPSIKDTDMLLSELIKRFKMLYEAMRWRDPKVELPEIGKSVIVKYRTAKNVEKYGIAKYFNLGIGNPWTIEGSTSREVVGWRPIE